MAEDKPKTGAATGTKTPRVAKDPPEGMVTVPAKQLEELMTRIKNVETDRDMLLQVADKKMLATFYERNKGKLPTHVNLRELEGKTILGWRTTEDEVYQDPVTMRWGEKQKVEVLFEDGTAKEYFLMDYVRKYKQVAAEVRQRIIDDTTGNVALRVVRLDTGKEYTIGLTFVN